MENHLNYRIRITLIKNGEEKHLLSWILKKKGELEIQQFSYSVIKASGTVEVIFKNIIYDYLIINANDKTKMYLEKMIVDSSCNPNTGNMSNMLQNISSVWKESFYHLVKESGHKDKLNSLVQLRNDFAHGESIAASIDTVIKYFKSAVEILKILDSVCT